MNHVFAGHEAKEAVFAQIVGALRASGIHQLPFAIHELITKRLNLHVGQRIAVFVGDAPRDDAPARQAEIDLVEDLPVSEVERLARFERARLTVFEGHEAPLVHAEAITPGRQSRDFKISFAVRRDDAAYARVLRVEIDLGAANGRASLGGDDASGDFRRACRSRRVVSWRRSETAPSSRKWRLTTERSRSRLLTLANSAQAQHDRHEQR